MKIQPRVSGRAEFLNTYYRIMREGLVLTRTDPHRLYNLRCSQLPYCPRSVILDYLERGKYRPMDLMMAYYTSVGTAVHTVMQTYLSQSGQFLADYSCKHCKIDYPLSHVHECTECGRHTHYEEVTIDVGTKNGRLGIQGHIDGIFKDSKGNYWIVDFKTTSVAGAPAKERTPGDGYTRQVKAYAVLLRKQYKIKVKGAMLVFIPRDNPARPKIWETVMSDRDYEVAKAELLQDRSLHRKTMRAETVKDVLGLASTNCGGAYCTHCKKSKPDFMNLVKKAMKKPKLSLPILKD